MYMSRQPRQLSRWLSENPLNSAYCTSLPKQLQADLKTSVCCLVLALSICCQCACLSVVTWALYCIVVIVLCWLSSLDVSGSSCHGRMSNGIFDGIVYTQEDTFFIEPAHRYFQSSQPFDGVIFRSSDVLLEHPHHSHNKTNCGMNEWMYRKMKTVQQMAQPIETKRRRRWVNTMQNVGVGR